MAQIIVISLLHQSVENEKDILYSCLYCSYVDHLVNDIKTQFYQILNEGTRLSKEPVWYSQWSLVNSYDGCPDLSACITLTVLSDIHPFESSEKEVEVWQTGRRCRRSEVLPVHHRQELPPPSPPAHLLAQKPAVKGQSIHCCLTRYLPFLLAKIPHWPPVTFPPSLVISRKWDLNHVYVLFSTF